MRYKDIIVRAAKLGAALSVIGLITSCSPTSGGISASGAGGTGSASLAAFKVLSFQGNTAANWNTDTAAVWKTNLNSVSIAGSCTRGIASIKVNQRLAGSGAALVDSGVTSSCVNNTFTWTKSFATDSNYTATSLGGSVQYDFNIYALDGIGNQVVDATALSAIKFYRLANTVLASVKYSKTYVQQTVSVSGSTTNITDTPDPDTGGPGRCPQTTAQFTLTGTVDPQATSSVTGAISTNLSSGSVLSYTVCVPFGSTSLVVATKDESGATVGTQYAVNITSSTVLQSIGSANEGFKSQSLSPMTPLTSQGLTLVNLSMEQVGKTTTNSTGATGYTLSTGLTSYTQQESP